MSARPGEVPAFDFGPDRIYNPLEVADKVAWPLVDALWRGDWRAQSQGGYEFQFPKRGKYQGRTLEVQLEAECLEMGESALHTASLFIEEEAVGIGRDFLLVAARTAAAELREQSDPDDEEELAELEWPEGDEKEFVVLKGIQYCFYTDSDWYCHVYRAVETPGRERLQVPVCEAEDDGTNEEQMRLPDIEIIESACYILKAPAAIMRALQQIKARPIELYRTGS